VEVSDGNWVSLRVNVHLRPSTLQGSLVGMIGSTAWGMIEFALCVEEGRTEKENLQLIVELQRNEIV
jgi:hypothetical protein